MHVCVCAAWLLCCVRSGILQSGNMGQDGCGNMHEVINVPNND